VTAESQLADLQRSVGRLEGKVDGLHEEMLDFRKMYVTRGSLIESMEERLVRMERRGLGVNGRTWGAILAAVGVIATAVAAAVAAVFR